MDEHGCSDLISQLVANSLLDVIPLLGSHEFSTPDYLLTKALQYLEYSGGRVTGQELQTYLNVDMHYVDKIIQRVCLTFHYLQ